MPVGLRLRLPRGAASRSPGAAGIAALRKTRQHFAGEALRRNFSRLQHDQLLRQAADFDHPVARLDGKMRKEQVLLKG